MDAWLPRSLQETFDLLRASIRGHFFEETLFDLDVWCDMCLGYHVFLKLHMHLYTPPKKTTYFLPEGIEEYLE